MPTLYLTAEAVKAYPVPERGKVDLYDTEITGYVCELRCSGKHSFYLKYRNRHGTLRQYKFSDGKSLTFEKARVVAEKLRARIVLGEDPMTEREVTRTIPTFAEFARDRYMPYAKATKRSWSCDDSLLRIHLLPRFGKCHLDEITTHAVTEFYHGKHAKGWAKGTCNRMLILMRYMYNLAGKWKIPGAENNPTKEVPLFELNNARERYLTQEEARRLYEAVKQSPQPMLQYIVPFLILTGARRREVLDCKYEDFDLARRMWRIPMTKSGKPRHVPLSEGALQVLMNVPKYKDCPWVFPNPKTLKPMVSGFAAWNTARKKAGLSDVRMHDLRHSFASFLVNSGRSLYEVQKLLGHSQIQTTQRYSHLAPETLLAAADAATCAAGLDLGGVVPVIGQGGPLVIDAPVVARLVA